MTQSTELRPNFPCLEIFAIAGAVATACFVGGACAITAGTFTTTSRLLSGNGV